MPQGKNGIATRQQTEELFSIHHPLGAGSSYVFPVREVRGYSAISYLAASDQSISVLIEESCEIDGPWGEMDTFISAVDPGSGLEVICRRRRPCGNFMRLTLQNLGGAMSTLSFCALGWPESGGGDTGGTGAQGPQGVMGWQGFQGNQGNQGAGPQGPQGSGGTGAQGNQGNQGEMGAGFQGPQGNQGDGVQGFQGAVGPQGNQGSQGNFGPQGNQGVAGTAGAQGFQGDIGPQGPQGNAGTNGTSGAQGFQGDIGPQGPQGNAGTNGTSGAQGFQGDVGPQGNQGWQGAGGTGVQGPQGNQGWQGFQGSGVQGPQGLSGSQGGNATNEFTFWYSGTLQTGDDLKIPVATKRANTDVDILEVELQQAPTGQAAIFEFFDGVTSLGTVSVAANTLSGNTPIALHTVLAGSRVKMTITQIGSIQFGQTATGYVRKT